MGVMVWRRSVCDTPAMPSYHIMIRDGAPEPCEAVETHPDMEAAHRSAVRSAVGILMDTEVLDGPLAANVAVREASTNLTRIVRVAVLVSHTIQRGDGGPQGPSLVGH